MFLMKFSNHKRLLLLAAFIFVLAIGYFARFEIIKGVFSVLPLETRKYIAVATTKELRLDNPYHFSVYINDPELIINLSEYAPYINTKTGTSVTMSALHEAAFFNYPEVAKALINIGADIESRTSQNETPLHIAVLHGNESVVKILLENNAKTDVVGGYKNSTPLHYAAGFGYLNILTLLISAKADIAIKDDSGRTPFEVACKSKQLKAAEKINPTGVCKIET